MYCTSLSTPHTRCMQGCVCTAVTLSLSFTLQPLLFPSSTLLLLRFLYYSFSIFKFCSLPFFTLSRCPGGLSHGALGHCQRLLRPSGWDPGVTIPYRDVSNFNEKSEPLPARRGCRARRRGGTAASRTAHSGTRGAKPCLRRSAHLGPRAARCRGCRTAVQPRSEGREARPDPERASPRLAPAQGVGRRVRTPLGAGAARGVQVAPGAARRAASLPRKVGPRKCLCESCPRPPGPGAASRPAERGGRSGSGMPASLRSPEHGRAAAGRPRGAG